MQHYTSICLPLQHAVAPTAWRSEPVKNVLICRGFLDLSCSSPPLRKTACAELSFFLPAWNFCAGPILIWRSMVHWPSPISAGSWPNPSDSPGTALPLSGDSDGWNKPRIRQAGLGHTPAAPRSIAHPPGILRPCSKGAWIFHARAMRRTAMVRRNSNRRNRARARKLLVFACAIPMTRVTGSCSNRLSPTMSSY